MMQISDNNIFFIGFNIILAKIRLKKKDNNTKIIIYDDISQAESKILRLTSL